MVAIDNSEYMRNGDYLTSRYQAQLDTVEIIFRRKINSNPENTVGLMTSAGNSPIVVSNLTVDFGQILSGLHSTNIGGESDLVETIQVACLALKNRQNKNQKQRIIVFVGSPIKNNESDLITLANKLKNSNISIDFINFGEHELNTHLLENFISITNTTDKTSHLVTVPPGPYLLYEQVEKTAIVREQDFDAYTDFGGADNGVANSNDNSNNNNNNNDFGFGMDDMNMDPELALAIRLSLEEENTRKEREKAAAEADVAKKEGSQDDDKMEED